MSLSSLLNFYVLAKIVQIERNELAQIAEMQPILCKNNQK